MKQITIAAIFGSLLFVAALQAQTPLQSVADPGFVSPASTPLAVDPPAYRDPQPADSSPFDERSIVPPGNVPHDPQAGRTR